MEIINNIQKNKKKITINKLFVLVFFLLDVRLFYIVKLPRILSGDGTNKLMLSIFCIIFFLLYFSYFKFKRGLFGEYIFLLYIILFMVSLNSYIKFDYKITQILWPLFPFFILLSYFIFRKILLQEDVLVFFIRVAEVCSCIVCVLFLIQRYFYLKDQTVFMQLDTLLPEFYYRHPELGFRIYSVFDGFTRIFILLTAYICIQKKFKNCVLSLLTTVLDLLAIILVDRSRYYIFLVVICIVIMFFLNNRHTIKTLLTGMLLLFAGLAVSYIIIQSISGSLSDNSGSRFARIGAISYYLSLLKQNNYLFGLGIANPSENSNMYTFLHGSDGYYHFDDIGLLGTFAKMGIFIVLWYIILIIRVIYISFSTSRKIKALSIAISIMFVLAVLTQSYLDPQRVNSLLFTIVLLEIIYKQPEKIIHALEKNKL